MDVRNCPFCGGNDVVPIGTQERYGFENISGREESWRTVMCRTCNASSCVSNQESVFVERWNKRVKKYFIKYKVNKKITIIKE